MVLQDDEHTPPPPTFAGRLNLQEFAFKPISSAGDNMVMSGSTARRSSPRLSLTPRSGASPASTSPSPARPTGLTLQVASTRAKRRLLHSLDDEVKAENADNNSTPTGSPAKSQSPNGRKRPKSGYAPPSTYAHLSRLPDTVGPDLLVLFVGLNPGIQTATLGHAYAHPSNHFWRLLHSGGVTTRLCRPQEDRLMPQLFSFGLTNIVGRPSRNGAELSKSEMDEGVAMLESKARRWRPEAVCLVGKSIWESVWRVRHGRAIGKADFRYGWQDEAENMGRGQPTDDERQALVDYTTPWDGARLFVATSTSGLAATLPQAEKQRIWRELGEWVERRREEKAKGEAKEA